MNNKTLALLWFVSALLFSVLNDSIMKSLNSLMSASKITFWRFFFSCITLFVFTVLYDIKSVKTINIKSHVLRGLLLSVAMQLWIYGMRSVPISTVTLMSFTIPIFTILLAALCLGERIRLGTILATILGFAGSVLTLTQDDFTFSASSSVLIVASILFATLDIFNKTLVNRGEKPIPMLFYSNLFSLLFSIFMPQETSKLFALTGYDIFLLLLLGIGANLILFCIIKAFSLVDASFLAPFRYLELVMSAIIGYSIFNEKLSLHMLVGGAMIIISSILVDRKIKTNEVKNSQ